MLKTFITGLSFFPTLILSSQVTYAADSFSNNNDPTNSQPDFMHQNNNHTDTLTPFKNDNSSTSNSSTYSNSNTSSSTSGPTIPDRRVPLPTEK